MSPSDLLQAGGGVPSRKDFSLDDLAIQLTDLNIVLLVSLILKKTRDTIQEAMSFLMRLGGFSHHSVAPVLRWSLV